MWGRIALVGQARRDRFVMSARVYLCHIIVVWLVLMVFGVDYVIPDKRGRVIRKYDHHFVNPIVANSKRSAAKAVHDEQTSYRRYHDNDLFVTQTANRIQLPHYAAIFPSVVPNPTTVKERLDLNLERNALPDDSNHSSPKKTSLAQVGKQIVVKETKTRKEKAKLLEQPQGERNR